MNDICDRCPLEDTDACNDCELVKQDMKPDEAERIRGDKSD